MAAAVVAAVGAFALSPGLSPALGRDVEATPVIGHVSIFASAPAPGHPFGIAVGDHRVFVSTSAGDFFADPPPGGTGHHNSDGERVFTYDKHGNLIGTTSIATMPDATMGLFGLALDGNPKPTHKLYVADMNGRILRVDLSGRKAAPRTFSKVPVASGLSGDWMKVDVERPRLRSGREPVRAGRQAADLAGDP